MFLRDALPQEYLVPLEANDSRLLESEFHSANYHAVTDIVNGLKTAVRLLGKVIDFFKFFCKLLKQRIFLL